MTNALTNNLYINEGVIAALDVVVQADAPETIDSANVDDVSVNDFNKIFAATVEKQNFTLGDMSKETEGLDEALNQAILEVTMEKALDLTLARDITEIINQLKSAVNLESPETDSNLENTDSADENDETVLPVFEQMLTFVNNKTDIICTVNDTVNDTVNNTENDIVNNTVGNTVNNTLSNTLNDMASEAQQVSEKYSLKEQKTLNGLAVKQTVAEDILKKDDLSETSSGIDDMLTELNIESVSSETDLSGDSYMNHQQSPEEYSVKVMLNTHNDKFDIHVDKTINSSNSVKVSEFSPEKIIEQIIKHMDSIKSNSKVSMVLNPESLGKINLQIINSRDGLSAQLTVMTNDVKELLMKGLDGLKEALITNGVAVDNILVKVSEPEESYNPDWTEQENPEDGQKGKEKQKHEEKEKGLFAKKMAESLEQKNGNV